MSSAANVLVLMGGPSPEHAVSLKSGQGITDALTRRGWRATALAIPQTLGVEEAAGWTEQALHRANPEVAFVALHGPFGEDGTIQALCERLHVPYTGSQTAASRLGMDKVASRERFIAAGITVPRWLSVTAALRRPPALTGWRYPLIVKPSNQGSSIGVSKVTQPSELEPALAAAAQYSTTLLIEEFVQGREVTAGVLAERALPVVEIVPKGSWFDFKAKYTQGLTEYRVPAELPPAQASAVQDAGLRAHQALGCRHFSRADMILSQAGTPVVLEVNTIPGFTPTSLLPKAAACIGIGYDELCERIVLMALAGNRSLSPLEKH